MVELVIRLVFSLAVVLGMLLLLTRLSAKKFRGGSDTLVRVLHRQPLSRTSAVAVLTVGSRVLVVGTTEHQVQLLTELDPEELDLPPEAVGYAGLVEHAEPVDYAEPDEYAEPVGSTDFDEPPELAELSGFSTLDELFEAAEGSEISDVAEGSEDSEEQAGAPRQLVAASSYTPRHAVPARARSVSRAPASAPADGALAGSLLSAQTWKQAFAAATGRARDVS